MLSVNSPVKTNRRRVKLCKRIAVYIKYKQVDGKCTVVFV